MIGLFYPYMLDKLLGIIICVYPSGSFNCLPPSYSEMAFSWGGEVHTIPGNFQGLAHF